MERIGLGHRPNHKPHGITKADRRAYKSEDLLKRIFQSITHLRKCVTDITEIKASDGGRCHDNARCESMWARMKSELFYGRYDTRKLTKDELKIKIWRFY